MCHIVSLWVTQVETWFTLGFCRFVDFVGEFWTLPRRFDLQGWGPCTRATWGRLCGDRVWEYGSDQWYPTSSPTFPTTMQFHFLLFPFDSINPDFHCDCQVGWKHLKTIRSSCVRTWPQGSPQGWISELKLQSVVPMRLCPRCNLLTMGQTATRITMYLTGIDISCAFAPPNQKTHRSF